MRSTFSGPFGVKYRQLFQKVCRGPTSATFKITSLVQKVEKRLERWVIIPQNGCMNRHQVVSLQMSNVRPEIDPVDFSGDVVAVGHT